MNVKGESTLGNFEKYLNLKKFSKNTVTTYIHYVNKFIISFNKPALHLTIKDAEIYISKYKYKSISQQNQIYSSIKLFYKFVLKIDLNNRIVFERPRKEKRLPQIIEKDFLLEKISKIENLKHNAIISLTFSTCMRVSEIINLKISVIDSKWLIININQAKGRKDRIVPLSPKILELLRLYYKEYKPKDYMFNGQNSQQYSPKIGNSFHFHLLRHSCFTSLLECGTDLRIIQSIAGHKNVKTTEIYTHVSTNLLNKVNLPI